MHKTLGWYQKLIEKIDDKPREYGKDYMKIKFKRLHENQIQFR